MATTISDATFTSTITDSVSLNNKEYGNTNSSLISSCNEAYERILHIPAALAAGEGVDAVCFQAILTLTPEHDTMGDVTFSEFEYARFTNLDSEYPIWIKVSNEIICSTGAATAATQTYTVKLDAGKSYIIPSSQYMATTGDIDCTAILESGGKRAELAIPTNMTVSAVAHTTVCDLEMFVVTR
tara:strand:+ start:312 stop:863 length:552 start_codon:yes stop_codon:yes gene_type:complete